jgi:hypothetical protein
MVIKAAQPTQKNQEHHSRAAGESRGGTYREAAERSESEVIASEGSPVFGY